MSLPGGSEVCWLATLDTTKRTALNNAADMLDSAIAAEVAKYSNFTFDDVRPYFTGHQLCDDPERLHSLSRPITDSYHPTSVVSRAATCLRSNRVCDALTCVLLAGSHLSEAADG